MIHNKFKSLKNIETIKNFKFIISLIWKVNPLFCIAKLISVLVSTITPFIWIIFPKFIIDAIVSQSGYNNVLKYILLMCGCLFVITILNIYIDTYMGKYESLIQFRLGEIYYDKVMDLNYDDLENPQILDLFEKSKSGFDVYGFFNQLVSLVSSSISLIGYIAILFTFNWLMLFIVFAVVVINLFCNKKKNKYNYKMNEAIAPHNRKFSYMANIMFDFGYIKEIKVNNLKGFILDKYNQEIKCFKDIINVIFNKLLIFTATSSLASLLQTFALYSTVAYAAVKGSISIGDFSMYLSSISAASGVILGIVSGLLSINQSLKYTSNMRSFFELERKVDNKKTAELEKEITELEFENVSFKYPNTERMILKHISFKVKSGEKISIVGKNGSGKTTLIKLILRLYEPTEGRILLNGKDIREYDYREYLKTFAPILQDYKIFAFTLKDNIVFDHPYDEDKLNSIIEDSGLAEKLKSLPNGAMTSMYKQFDENGIEFSGGENQKVAIARAIYKNSPIILLDEPTANLDPLAEYDIYLLIYNMLKGKTSFFVSHRLASCRFCSRIFMIDDGKLVADGSHDELMKCCPIYNEMFNKQAQFYVSQS